MKFMIIFALLAVVGNSFAQTYATAPQPHARNRYYVPGHQQLPPSGYVTPGYQPQIPPQNDEDYGNSQCSDQGQGYGQPQPPAQQLNGLQQACAQWDQHPQRRTGQLAEMKVRIICRQAMIISARVETKTMNGYTVTSQPVPVDSGYTVELTCQQIAAAQYNIVNICSSQNSK